MCGEIWKSQPGINASDSVARLAVSSATAAGIAAAAAVLEEICLLLLFRALKRGSSAASSTLWCAAGVCSSRRRAAVIVSAGASVIVSASLQRTRGALMDPCLKIRSQSSAVLVMKVVTCGAGRLYSSQSCVVRTFDCRMKELNQNMEENVYLLVWTFKKT